MSRKTARKHAFTLIFETEFHDRNQLDELFGVFFEENRISDEDKAYITETVSGVMAHLVEIDGLIEKHLRKWSKDRVGKVDMAILRLGVFEMRESEVPVPVAINEAVELAKEYGDEDAPGFIHGVLGAIDAKEEEQL